jgi:hypothetical protein
MVRKKINTEEIDEDFIIASIKTDNQEPEINTEETKVQKPVKRKPKQKGTGYISLFLSNSNIKARSGKLIYVRPEYHEKVSKIIQVIGKNEISIFSYIDNVLMHHFEEFQEEIIKHYRENNKDIF